MERQKTNNTTNNRMISNCRKLCVSSSVFDIVHYFIIFVRLQYTRVICNYDEVKSHSNVWILETFVDFTHLSLNKDEASKWHINCILFTIIWTSPKWEVNRRDSRRLKFSIFQSKIIYELVSIIIRNMGLFKWSCGFCCYANIVSATMTLRLECSLFEPIFFKISTEN